MAVHVPPPGDIPNCPNGQETFPWCPQLTDYKATSKQENLERPLDVYIVKRFKG